MASKWMHELGFEVFTKKKGTFVYGHECNDIVEYRIKQFLKLMVSLGFLSSDNALTHMTLKKVLPTDITLDLPKLCFYFLTRPPFR